MQSTTARIGVLAALVAVAVVLFIVLSGSDDDDGDATTTAAATTATGTPVGGVQELTFTKGDQVRFVVELDQPEEEVHVHGYEITEPATSSPVRLNFQADIDGVFDVEVHSHEVGDIEIAKLTVNP
jgi:hypothetical protein